MSYSTMSPSPDKAFFVVENGFVYHCPGIDFFLCYDLHGEPIWSRKQNITSILSSDKNQICFFKKLAKNEYAIDALDPKTGDTLWTDQINVDSMPSLTVLDGYAVYPVTYDKVIVRSIDTGEVVQTIKNVNGFNSVWGISGFGFMIAGKDGYLHFFKRVNDLPDKH